MIAQVKKVLVTDR